MLILITFFLISCSPKVPKNEFDFFNSTISFEEFKQRLDEYAKNNPYPNIDN